jgi:hypothetical protein
MIDQGARVGSMYFDDLVEAYDASRAERNAFHDLMRYQGARGPGLWPRCPHPPHGDEQREPRDPGRHGAALAGRALAKRLEAIDRVFVWNGYSKLFVGMLKQVEDLRNVDADTRTGLVRVILLIEDSVRYYSRYLPLLFQVVQRQAQALIEAEKGVETQSFCAPRARPKILLASSYEEASPLFSSATRATSSRHHRRPLPRAGKSDPEAGFDFIKHGQVEAFPSSP